MKRNPIQFSYRFKFESSVQTNFTIALDPETLSFISHEDKSSLPEWTKLVYKQCRCCKLTNDQQVYCPIAVNIMELVEIFKTVVSYHDCEVTCKTAERIYVKNTSVMEGLSSIFGVIMATSDCPTMMFLKPMARFHLPFATIEETTVRTASLFLLRQYFEQRGTSSIVCNFKDLENQYTQVQQVNEGLLERINSVSSEDADKNAIITLHSLSQFLSMEFDYSLGSLDYLFSSLSDS